VLRPLQQRRRSTTPMTAPVRFRPRPCPPPSRNPRWHVPLPPMSLSPPPRARFWLRRPGRQLPEPRQRHQPAAEREPGRSGARREARLAGGAPVQSQRRQGLPSQLVADDGGRPPAGRAQHHMQQHWGSRGNGQHEQRAQRHGAGAAASVADYGKGAHAGAVPRQGRRRGRHHQGPHGQRRGPRAGCVLRPQLVTLHAGLKMQVSNEQCCSSFPGSRDDSCTHMSC